VLPSIGTGDFVVRVQGLRLPTTRIEAGLYSASGAFVRKIKLGNGDNELDMESSPAGLYFLRANGAILKMVVVR
jgi:hypothetical protein